MTHCTISYFGWSSLAVTTADGTLLFDPFYRRYCGVQWFTAEDLGPAKYIAVTHGHEEHFLDTPELARRTGALVVGPGAVTRFLRQRNRIDEAQLATLEAGQTKQLDGFRVDAFAWKHRDVNLVKSVTKAMLKGNFTQLAWAWHSATQAPFHAPYTGYRLTLPDGTTILNYNEGFNSKMTDAEIEVLGRAGRTDILLAGMQLDFTEDVFRGVKALDPKLVLLYPPHDVLHTMMGAKSRPWPEFAAAAQRAAPHAKVVMLEPGVAVNASNGSVSRFTSGRRAAQVAVSA